MKSLLRAAVILAVALSPAAAAFAPSAALAQAGRPLQRGDYLPPEALKAGPNVDYAAERLRRPPAGYGWFRVGAAFALASLSTGLIVEVVGP